MSEAALTNEKLMKLVSIHLPSNKPFHFRRLVENLFTTADDPTSFEIVVKIDIGDDAMSEAIRQIREAFPVSLKIVVSERPASYFHTYIAFNELLKASDPEYYFCWHVNDEILIQTRGWDTKLARYVGFFPDHVFRLKVNPKKMFRNFFDIHEVCVYADYPIVPRKWLEATEVWADCHGPDIYQESIAIYLARYGYHRNVPLLDIVVGGDEAGENLGPERALARAQGTCPAWDYSLSATRQERHARAARRLQLFIMAHELGLKSYELREETDRRAILLVENERVYARVFFAIDYVGVAVDHFDYIARREWPHSLWGKSAAYRGSVHIYRAIHNGYSWLLRVAKFAIGLTLGFHWKALISGLVAPDSTIHSALFWLERMCARIHGARVRGVFWLTHACAQARLRGGRFYNKARIALMKIRGFGFRVKSFLFDARKKH